MRIRGLARWIRGILRARANEGSRARLVNGKDVALLETRQILDRLKSVPGLWDQLDIASSEGRPQCLRRITGLIRDAGLIETEADIFKGSAQTIQVYSEHHEAVPSLALPPNESSTLTTVVWAIEGMSFKA